MLTMTALFLILLQETVSSRGGVRNFWPQSAQDWIGLVAQTILIILTVAGLVGKWVNGKLNGLGDRVKVVETAATATKTKLDDLGTKMQASEFDRASMHENIGRLEGMVEKLVQDNKAEREKEHIEEKEIIARLAGIEAKMDIGKAVENVGRELVRELQHQNRRRERS